PPAWRRRGRRPPPTPRPIAAVVSARVRRIGAMAKAVPHVRHAPSALLRPRALLRPSGQARLNDRAAPSAPSARPALRRRTARNDASARSARKPPRVLSVPRAPRRPTVRIALFETGPIVRDVPTTTAIGPVPTGLPVPVRTDPTVQAVLTMAA